MVENSLNMNDKELSNLSAEKDQDEMRSDSFNESLADEELFKINQQLIQQELQKNKLRTEESKTNKITEAFENLLCTKLIISKESNLLILKPYFCYEILFHLKNAQNVNIKLEIVEKLNWIINKIHTNAYIIANKSTLKNFKTNNTVNFMNEIIDILIENNREHNLSEKLLTFLERVIFLSGIKVRYVKHIFEKLAELFDMKNYDGNKFVLYLKLLNRMFQKTIHDGQKFPEKYFFFNNTNSELRVDRETLQYKNISIVKGYSIVMWIRPEHVNLDSSNKKIIDSSLLYYIHTSKYISFEVYLKNKSIFYRIVYNINDNSQKNEGNLCYIFDVEYGKWTMLVFSHKPSSFLQKSEFIAWKDSHENFCVKNVEIPNVKSQKILSIGFFKDFTGQATNVFMLNESISNHNVIKDLGYYTFGFYNEKNIRIFKDFLEQDIHNSKSQSELKQVFESIIFIFSPCRVRNNICKDIIDNINGEITTTIEGNMLVGGVVHDLNIYNNISFLGGLQVFLPIFEFFSSSQFISSNVLEEAINLIITVIDKKNFFEKNSETGKFFNFLSIFFENYNKAIFSREIVLKLLQIAEILTRNETNPKEFFKYLLFNPKIFSKFEIYLQIELWKNICELHSNRILNFNSFFDAKDAFELIIKVYDNDLNLYCCNDHYKMLCETVNKDIVIINPPLLAKTSSLLTIIENILTSNKLIAIDQLRQIVPFLSYEISPCLQKSFLTILNKIFKSNDHELSSSQKSLISIYSLYSSKTSTDEKTRMKYILAFTKAKGLEHLLYIMNVSTIDVRLECIKIFELFSKIPSVLPFNIEDDFIPFIVHSVFPLKTPLRNLKITNTNKENTNNNKQTEVTIMEKNMLRKSIKNEYYVNMNRDAFINTNSEEGKITTNLSGKNDIVNLLDDDTMKFSNEEESLSSEYTISKTKEKFIEKSTLLNVKEIINLEIEENQINRINKNSLISLEEDYWRMMSKGGILKNLSVPITYSKYYSNNQNDLYVEKLYEYLMKWMTNHSISRRTTDDADNIEFEPALNIIMKLIMHSNIIIKQKCLVDFLMLTVYNKNNCYLMIKNKYFYQWLLDLILPYQVLLIEKFAEHRQSGLAATIIELGVKIHTNVIINSLFHEEPENAKRNEKNYSDKNHGKTDHSLIFQFLLTWMYKIKKISAIEGKAACVMIRYILIHLVNAFRDHLKLMSPSYNFPIWQNFLNLTLIIYEFIVYSNFDKKISKKQINFDQLEKNEILVEIIQNLNYDYDGQESEKNNFNSLGKEINLNNFRNENEVGGVAMIDIWIDKELFFNLYDCYKGIWQENVFKTEKKSSSILSDELKYIENITNKMIFENKPNFFIEDLKILLFSSSTDNISFEQGRSNNILRAILNFLIITIRLSENKNDVLNWIRELEKFTLFIISASENAKIAENIQLGKTFLLYAQEETLQALAIVINFLIEELNSPRRGKFSTDLQEIFVSTLRFVFIYFTHIVERVNILIQSNSSENSYTIFSYLNSLKNAILIRPTHSPQFFSPCWKLYSEFLLDKSKSRIFSIEDIKEFKLNKFVDIPEKFNSEGWIYAFQENNAIYKLIKSQFNFGYFEKLIRTRIFQADFLIPNNEICVNEKTFINKVYRRISNSIKESLQTLENKFKLEIFENFLNKKTLIGKWKSLKKGMFQWKGKWCNLEKFLNLSEGKKIKYKVANHYTKSLSRPLLFSIFEINHFFPKFSKFNKEIFLDLNLNLDNYNINSNKIVSKETHILTTNTFSSCDSYDSKENSEKNITNLKDKINNKSNNINELLKVKQYTNKSLIYYTDSEFSDFIDKYSNVEKLVKYFQLFYSIESFPEIILNMTECFIKLNGYTNVFDVCMIKLKGHKKGKIIITSDEIIFVTLVESFRNKTEENTKCVDSLFPLIEKPNQKFTMHIPISDVRQIHKRRLYYKKTALEIFTSTNKSYYFNFNTQTERDSFCKLVYELSNFKDNPFLFEYHIDIKKNGNVLNKLVDQWNNWKISNFDFLMNLNIVAGRSYLDLTQYPVFPWVLNQYNRIPKKVTENILRDLSKPLGALGNEERKGNFEMTFHESSSNVDEALFNEGAYFYNSHYSNPFYVTNFLARVLPYSACCVELQGEGFDHPQRQFLSVSQAFYNTMNQPTDLRELIPEFFFMPEMFLNMNNIDFGKIDGKTIEDVELPLNDPYLFIITNRLSLESELVSSKINEWIDLIFGAKQRGKEAEGAKNLFWKFTYEDEVDIDTIQKNNPDEYNSFMSKIFFGQSPSQIILKPLITKQTKETSKVNKMFIESKRNLKVFHSTSEVKNKFKTRKDIINKMIIKIKSLENDRIICVYNNGTVQINKVDDTPYSLSRFIFIREKETTMNKLNKAIINQEYEKDTIKYITDEDDSIMKDVNINQPVKILGNGKYIIKGGYFDGKFLLFDMQTEQMIYLSTEEDSKVTCIESDEKEKTLFVGTSTGRIYLFKINSNLALNQVLTHYNLLCDHDNKINYIYICNRLNVVATVANDKTCNLYTFPDIVLYRVIKHSTYNFDYVFLSINPLPCVILYSQSDLKFYSYSINGTLIHTENDGVKYLFSPQIISDASHRDHLVYGTETGIMMIRPLPYLNNSWRIELNKRSESESYLLPIKCFDMSKDKRSIYFWQLEDFNISVIRNPKESKKKKQAEIDKNSIKDIIQKTLFDR